MENSHINGTHYTLLVCSVAVFSVVAHILTPKYRLLLQQSKPLDQ